MAPLRGTSHSTRHPTTAPHLRMLRTANPSPSDVARSNILAERVPGYRAFKEGVAGNRAGRVQRGGDTDAAEVRLGRKAEKCRNLARKARHQRRQTHTRNDNRVDSSKRVFGANSPGWPFLATRATGYGIALGGFEGGKRGIPEEYRNKGERSTAHRDAVVGLVACGLARGDGARVG